MCFLSDMILLNVLHIRAVLFPCCCRTKGTIYSILFAIGTSNICSVTFSFSLSRDGEWKSRQALDADVMRLKVNCYPRHVEECRSFRENWISSRVDGDEYKGNADMRARGWTEWNFQTGRFIKGYRWRWNVWTVRRPPLTSGSVPAVVRYYKLGSFARWHELFGLADCPRRYLPSTPCETPAFHNMSCDI